ncbi:unnamed protein product [Amoebophrya sp. A120]|nr:unnamed protein product [Amoebophrya sp. A120]|eukprot:GSA120T00007631001.1
MVKSNEQTKARYYAAGQAPEPQVVVVEAPTPRYYRAARDTAGSQTLLRVGISVTQGLVSFFSSFYLFLLIWGARMDMTYVAGWMRDGMKSGNVFNYSFIKYLSYGYGTKDKSLELDGPLPTPAQVGAKLQQVLQQLGLPVPVGQIPSNLDTSVVVNFFTDVQRNMFNVSVAEVCILFALVFMLQIAKCTPLFRDMKKTTGLLVFLIITLVMVFVSFVLGVVRWARVAQLFSAENAVIWNEVRAGNIFSQALAMFGAAMSYFVGKNYSRPSAADMVEIGKIDYTKIQASTGMLWLMEVWMPVTFVTSFILIVWGYCRLPKAYSPQQRFEYLRSEEP